MNCNDIRKELIRKYTEQDLVIDKSGCKMVELIGSSFTADEPAIFGEPNYEYIERELQWYESQSLSIGDIPGEPPKIWADISDSYGYVNSNYGYLIYHENNGYQYANVRDKLLANRDTRQGTMVYNRPSIHKDAEFRGRKDFICTNAVNYFIREDHLHAVVQMRSNDVIFGYRNDIAWQQEVLRGLAEEVNAYPGKITWQAASLHVYERHFKFLDEYINSDGSDSRQLQMFG